MHDINFVPSADTGVQPMSADRFTEQCGCLFGEQNLVACACQSSLTRNSRTHTFYPFVRRVVVSRSTAVNCEMEAYPKAVVVVGQRSSDMMEM